MRVNLLAVIKQKIKVYLIGVSKLIETLMLQVAADIR